MVDLLNPSGQEWQYDANSASAGNSLGKVDDSAFSNFWNGLSDWWQNSPLMPSYWQRKFNNFIGGVTSASKQGEIAYTESGLPYDKTNTDSQINALMQEYANKRDDQAYDRLIVALKRNGINPAIALSNSASPMASDSGFRSSYNLTSKDQINSALKAGSIIALVLSLLMRKGG